MTFLLIMLHTGTMFAVIAYFWKSWRSHFLSTTSTLRTFLVRIVAATIISGVVYLVIKKILGKTVLHSGDVEELFSNLTLVAGSLAAAGVLILVAGLASKRPAAADSGGDGPGTLSGGTAMAIGFVQGVCLPFRGFSRSGATISTGMLLGVGRRQAEEFSFALAVLVTPPAIGQEFLRLLKARASAGAPLHGAALAVPGLIGMVAAFVAGLVALRWLSRWLEEGRWHYFGVYCLVAAVGIWTLAHAGY